MTDPKDKTQELLAVLDMPEVAQKVWLCTNDIIGHETDKNNGAVVITESLADLAVRLRGEALDNAGNWRVAKHLIYSHHMGEHESSESPFFHGNCQGFFTDYAQPIHFIIAALLAKEMK